MLLQWTESRGFDGHGNTAWEAGWSDNPASPMVAYRISPAMRDDRIVYLADMADASRSGEWNRSGPHRSAEVARMACEKAEAMRVGHMTSPAEAILDWATRNPRLTHIDPERLALGCPDHALPDLVAQLEAWKAEGRLQAWHAVRSPGGPLGHSPSGRESWRSPERIPARLRDTGDESFRMDDGTIIPVYRKPDGSPIGAGI